MKPIVTVNNNVECERILINAYTGILVMSRGETPYAVPMNHTFFNGKIYFHCAVTGLKLDMIRTNPNVCYVVKEFFGEPDPHKKGFKCHGEWESVIAYGKARVISEPEEQQEAFAVFMKHYGTKDYVASEKQLSKTNAIIIEVESMTARREVSREEKTAYWSWSPES